MHAVYTLNVGLLACQPQRAFLANLIMPSRVPQLHSRHAAACWSAAHLPVHAMQQEGCAANYIRDVAW